MIRQKSFENSNPTLYLVPTPIGNLNEMTPRALEVLNSVDVIACEDTRNSGQLLKHFGISKRLIAYQNFNEESSSAGIVNLLSQGNNIALISDAGYPLISDPGQRVVMDASEAGFNVVPLSGCNAMLNGLVASGLVAQPFLFIGFLPSATNECIKKLQEYKQYPMTMVFYEAPHRIEKMMNNCLQVLGDRKCCIARELTKLHEEFIRGTISEIIPELPGLRGEMVVVIDGCHEDPSASLTDEDILKMVDELRENGLSASRAIKEAATRTGVSKNKIYDLVNHREEEDE